MPDVEWVEQKGPKCIPTAAIQRALLYGSAQVDFVMANHARIRAQFDEDCPALDFYGGFYLQVEDDRLCARRDAIHSRIRGPAAGSSVSNSSYPSSAASCAVIVLAAETEPNSKPRLIILKRNLAAVKASNGTDHGKAKSTALRRPRFLQAAILADGVRAELFRDTGPFIADGDSRRGRRDRPRQIVYSPTGIFERVVGEVSDRPADHLAITKYRIAQPFSTSIDMPRSSATGW